MSASRIRFTQRALATTAVGLGAALLLSACQVGLGEDDAQRATSNATAGARATDGALSATLKPADLPPKGIVRIDGATRGTLTAKAVSIYNQVGYEADVKIGNNGAQTGFARLCTGEIDLVDSARSISARELEVCRQHGLQVVQFQMAADAVVLAIKSETDVGGDCLRLNQVKEIYRAGSAVTNWRDLGFANVPIRVGGPDRDNNAFDFFGSNVMDAPEPSMSYLRSDYLEYENDAAMRVFVVGTQADRERALVATQYEQQVASRKGVVSQAKANFDAAKATRAAAIAERRKGIIDNRSPRAQAQDQARVDAARRAARIAQRELIRQRSLLASLETPAAQAAASRKALAGLRGRVAYFRFSYYELFEDDLRPFEVSADAGPLNCVFPSEATITSGAYPLSRRLLVTATTRSLDRGEVKDFLSKHLLTAQQRAIDNRMVPIQDSLVAQQLAWVRGTEPARLLTPADLSNEPEELEQAR